MNIKLHEDITKKIIECAYRVHKVLGKGFLEKVYRNALCIELQNEGLQVLSEYPINVFYKDKIVGEYFTDIIVDNKVIVELKAISKLLVSHEWQLLNYLSATKIDTGLLVNFGAEKLQYKRKVRAGCMKVKVVMGEVNTDLGVPK